MVGRYKNYFQTAVLLIKNYSGVIPFHHYSKQYFSAHKKHGSTDRKRITQLCYSYFRLGHALNNLSVDERLKVAFFLCNDTAGDWYLLYDTEWIEGWSKSITERIIFITNSYSNFSVSDIFPYRHELSEGINENELACSHLLQPNLFIRIRPGKTKLVKQKLEAFGIHYEEINETCLSLNNTTRLDTILDINKEVIVQDYSSQHVASFLSPINRQMQPPKVWDCCAASGGKSLLAFDLNNAINLTVSDLRPSILYNLKQRFKDAGIRNYHSFVADLTQPNLSGIPDSTYDFIICDAPCSGSGTWSRTPEQLTYFQEKEISRYAELQQKIASTAIPSLKKNGFLLYITCSVFRKENEDQVNFIQQKFSLKLHKMELLKGYDKKADTMFAALFYKG